MKEFFQPEQGVGKALEEKLREILGDEPLPKFMHQKSVWKMPYDVLRDDDFKAIAYRKFLYQYNQGNYLEAYDIAKVFKFIEVVPAEIQSSIVARAKLLLEAGRIDEFENELKHFKVLQSVFYKDLASAGIEAYKQAQVAGEIAKANKIAHIFMIDQRQFESPPEAKEEKPMAGTDLEAIEKRIRHLEL